MKHRLLTVSFPFLCLAFAAGNDTMMTKSTGGLIPLKTSDVRMISEDLHISLERIDIHYVFKNESSHDIDATIAFPLPALDGGEVYYANMELPDEKQTNFLDFQITSDGRKVPARLEMRAISGDETRPIDITGYLKRLGVSIDVRQVGGFPCPLTQKLRKRMTAQKLLFIDDANPTVGCLATWETRIQFVWTQHFAAGAEVYLHQSYKPFLGGGYNFVKLGQALKSQLVDDTRTYCWTAVGTESLSRLSSALSKQHHAQNEDPEYQYREIKYILTTARNWKGPIQNFKLTIELPTSNDVLLICHPVKQTTNTAYVFEAHDFIPDFDLNLEILGPSEDFN